MSFNVTECKGEIIKNSSYREDIEIQSISSTDLQRKVIRVVDEILQLAIQTAHQGHRTFKISLSALPYESKFELIKEIVGLDAKTIKIISNLFDKYFHVKLEPVSIPKALELTWVATNELLQPKPEVTIYQPAELSLGGYFKSLFNSPEFSDMQIEVEGRTIYVHKIVLMRNVYFKTFLTSSNQWKEIKENKVTFEECEYRLVYLFLLYLYTDEFPQDEIGTFNACKDMLLFADRFQCDALVYRCKMKLKDFLPSYLDEIIELQQIIRLTELKPLCEWHKQHRL